MADAERPVGAEFGRKLRSARKGARLPQEELAHRAGLHRSAISLLERGERVPRIDTVIALAQALAITPGSLLDGIRVKTAKHDRRRRG